MQDAAMWFVHVQGHPSPL